MLGVVVLFACLGCLTGFLAGLLGIGGGLIIVPMLVYILPSLEFPPELIMPVAIATSLSSIIFTTVVGSFAHHKNNNIPWQIARQLMLMIAVGALFGAYLADSIPTKVLQYIFAVAVILLASYMLLSVRISNVKPFPKPWVIRLIGLFTGLLSSLMGIAGGAILVPILTYYSMSVRKAIGTATVCGFVVACFGSVGFIVTGLDQTTLPAWSIGYVYLPALFGVMITSSLFVPLGVKYASKLPVQTLKKVFAVFLIMVAVKMVWS
jgi:hypothetical protein